MSALADMPAVLTVEEAETLLRIGRSAAYEGVRSGEIPSIKVGRSIRIPRHRLEQLLGLHNDNELAANELVATTSAGMATDGRAPV